LEFLVKENSVYTGENDGGSSKKNIFVSTSEKKENNTLGTIKNNNAEVKPPQPALSLKNLITIETSSISEKTAQNNKYGDFNKEFNPPASAEKGITLNKLDTDHQRKKENLIKKLDNLSENIQPKHVQYESPLEKRLKEVRNRFKPHKPSENVMNLAKLVENHMLGKRFK
jgi:hypothetical protein